MAMKSIRGAQQTTPNQTQRGAGRQMGAGVRAQLGMLGALSGQRALSPRSNPWAQLGNLGAVAQWVALMAAMGQQRQQPGARGGTGKSTPDRPAPTARPQVEPERPELGVRQTVQYFEKPNPRLGPVKAAPQVNIDDKIIDEGQLSTIAAQVTDPEAPGRTGHMWYAWRQLSGPSWRPKKGLWQPSLEVAMPQVPSDKFIAAELKVTKRGYLKKQGVQTTQKFLVKVKDVGPGPGATKPPSIDPGGLFPWLPPPVIPGGSWPPATEHHPPGTTPQNPGPETPGPEVPGPETPGPEVPGPEVPGPETPGPEVPGPEVPGPEVPGPETPGPETPGPETPGPETPGPETPGPETPGPKVAENQTARVWGDPHFVGGDGGKFDVQGKNGKTYNLLSDSNLKFFGTFEGNDQVTFVGETELTVHGAGGTSRLVMRPKKDRATLNGKNVEKGKGVAMADGGQTTRKGKTITTTTAEGYTIVQHDKGGHIDAEIHTGDAGVGNGKLPTGLMGHTFDADDKKRDGKKGKGAQGEGAIDGVYTDYEIRSFDKHFYLAMYPDVADAVVAGKVKARHHYDQHGKLEGRLPRRSGGPTEFKENFYLKTNPDVAQAVAKGHFKSGAHHFWLHGRKEGRQMHP